jgi:hypothetical protein
VGETSAGPSFGSLRDHTPWALLSLALGLVGLGLYLAVDRSSFEDRWQTWLGVAAAVLLLLGTLFSAVKHWQLGRLRPWYLLHLWALLLWGPLAWMHADGAARGVFYASLAAAGWLAWLSGLAGVVLQRSLAEQRRLGAAEVGLLEDLTAERDRLLAEIDDLMKGREQAFRAACSRLSLPLPGRGLGLWSLVQQVLRPQRARTRARGRMQALASLMAEPPPELVERVCQDVVELEHCRARLALQRLRQVWLTAHVVSAAPLLALLVVHVLAVLRY